MPVCAPIDTPLLAVTLALTAATWTSQAQKANEKVQIAQGTLKVEGLTCAGCEAGGSWPPRIPTITIESAATRRPTAW